MPETDAISDDAFLGGRLRLLQPRRGHRAGHDAMLLAASVAVRAGDVIIDLGAGVGAAGLAVAMRVSGIDLALVEIEPGLCALASENAARNHLSVRVVNADVMDRAALDASGIGPDSADAVLMNPPFNDARNHQASPDDARRSAHVASDLTLESWTKTALRLLKPRGEVTLIWRADGLAAVLASLGNGFGGVVVQPLYPAPDKAAVRILVRAVKASRAPLSILPGLNLDGSDVEVQGALNGQGALPLARCEPNRGERVSLIAEPFRSNATAKP